MQSKFRRMLAWEVRGSTWSIEVGCVPLPVVYEWRKPKNPVFWKPALLKFQEKLQARLAIIGIFSWWGCTVMSSVILSFDTWSWYLEQMERKLLMGGQDG